MKKRLFASLLLALCLLLPLGGAALAAVSYVTDEAGLLSAGEIQALESRAGQIAEEYGCAPYILLVQDFRDYVDTYDIFEAGMDIYERWGLGYGQEKNGLLLILSMDERDYALVTYGSLSHVAFTDFGQDYLEENFLDDLGYDDWAAGLSDYLEYSASLLEQAENGVPYDVDTAPRGFNPLIIIIPLVVALVVCLVMAGQMRTANRKTGARDYVIQSGTNMRVVQDIFTHRTVSRQVIQQNSGGGGGTSINSRGFSGGSGKF